MDREEAIEIIRKNMPSDKSLPVYEALQTLVPELAESEDERARKWLLDYAIEMIAGLESDISLSNYDGIKGHDPEAEAELAQWQKARAYLEKQKNLDKMIVVSPEVWDNAISDAYENGKKEGEKQKEQKHYWKPTETDVALFNKAVTTNNTLTPAERANLDIIRSKFGCCHAINCSGIMQKEQKLSEHSAKGRRGRMGGIPEHIRKKAENFLSKMEPPYDADDICSAYEAGALESAKPAELEQLAKLREMTHEIRDAYERGIEVGRVESKQEWSEEEEKMLRTIISDGSRGVELDSKQISFLKSLRPSWKPSEQEKGALRTAIYVLTEERNFPKTTEQLQAILDAFDGKESRKDWKPSEEQEEEPEYYQHFDPDC